MCKAAKFCIAEVEEIVDIDEIPPGQVIIFRVKSKDYTNHIPGQIHVFSSCAFTIIGPRPIYICSKSFTRSKL